MNFPPRGGFEAWGRVIAVIAVIGCALLLAGCGAAPESAPESGGASAPEARPASTAPTQAELRRALDLALAREAGWNRREAPEEEPEIAEHVDALRHDLAPEEAAARLWALGNLLQQKKGDYAAAAGYYELLLQHHPEWEGSAGVYRALIGCYTALGDYVSVRNVYRRIQEHFPKDSEEYRAAERALKR